MGKVFVRKNQHVNYTVYALHRMKDLWGSDAEEFKPKRWIGRKYDWEYLPFNDGPRVCLGRECHPYDLKSLYQTQTDHAYIQNNLH